MGLGLIENTDLWTIMDRELIRQELMALKQGQTIIRRCQKYIETMAKTEPSEIKGMVMLLKNIKDVEEEFNYLQNK